MPIIINWNPVDAELGAARMTGSAVGAASGAQMRAQADLQGQRQDTEIISGLMRDYLHQQHDQATLAQHQAFVAGESEKQRSFHAGESSKAQEASAAIHAADRAERGAEHADTVNEQELGRITREQNEAAGRTIQQQNADTAAAAQRATESNQRATQKRAAQSLREKQAEFKQTTQAKAAATAASAAARDEATANRENDASIKRDLEERKFQEQKKQNAAKAAAGPAARTERERAIQGQIDLGDMQGPLDMGFPLDAKGKPAPLSGAEHMRAAGSQAVFLNLLGQYAKSESDPAKLKAVRDSIAPRVPAARRKFLDQAIQDLAVAPAQQGTGLSHTSIDEAMDRAAKNPAELARVVQTLAPKADIPTLKGWITEMQAKGRSTYAAGALRVAQGALTQRMTEVGTAVTNARSAFSRGGQLAGLPPEQRVQQMSEWVDRICESYGTTPSELEQFAAHQSQPPPPPAAGYGPAQQQSPGLGGRF